MKHLPRLLRVVSVIARYRLGEFLRPLQGASLVKFSLGLLTLPWALLPTPGNNRNERLRMALEELGPIYIKFGQLLSTRRDFLDPELADELQSLQDNVPPFATPAPDTIIKQALGSSTDDLFAEFDPIPFASASVAQVHQARLKSGEEVVVKIIRPGIENTIRADIRLLKWLANLVQDKSDLGKRLRPVQVVADYEKVIFNELNLLMEAANTTQLRRNFDGSSVLYVPKVYWDYTRQNILVMERIHGIPVTDITEVKKLDTNMKVLAETGVDIFFTQVFEHNFFHADM
ncbi:MAG: AarF/UbiB family protein, partial [Pseudomonadales bacterium]